MIYYTHEEQVENARKGGSDDARMTELEKQQRVSELLSELRELRQGHGIPKDSHRSTFQLQDSSYAVKTAGRCRYCADLTGDSPTPQRTGCYQG